MTTEQDQPLLEALCSAFTVLERDGIDVLIVGGIALSYHLSGEPEMDHDIDLLIREDDVERAMRSLEAAGFEVVRTHPTWLFKARLGGATVDVLHVLGRVLRFDDEMVGRAIEVDVDGCRTKIVSREDLAVGRRAPRVWRCRASGSKR